jgi:hypothetical protein
VSDELELAIEAIERQVGLWMRELSKRGVPPEKSTFTPGFDDRRLVTEALRRGSALGPLRDSKTGDALAYAAWMNAVESSIIRRAQLRRTSLRVLDVWTLWMPQRIVTEELGDCLEDINRRIRIGQSKWLVWGRVVATAWWLTINSIGYFLKASGIRKAS